MLRFVIHGWAKISMMPIVVPNLYLGFLFRSPLNRDFIYGDKVNL